MLDKPERLCYNKVTKEEKEIKKMKITVDYENLKNLFTVLIEKGIGCQECPYYDKCDGVESSEECAELFIDQIAIEEL